MPTTQILRLTRCGVGPTAFAKRPAESVVALFAADAKRILVCHGRTVRLVDLGGQGRLVFSWPPLARSDVVSTVTVELFLRPDNGTLLCLTHEGLSDDETARANEQGWSAVLDMLKRRGPDAG